MLLEIQNNQLVALCGKRTIVIQSLTTGNRATATSRYYGITIDLALEVLETGLRIGRLLRTREIAQ